MSKSKSADAGGGDHAGADPLAALRGDFNRLVERLQTPEAVAGGLALFVASGAELGALAVAHAPLHESRVPIKRNEQGSPTSD